MQRLGPSQAPLCTLDLPTSISPRVLNALKADPRTVDLRSLAGNFYEGAARCLELFEEEEIVDILCEVSILLEWGSERESVSNWAMKPDVQEEGS